MSLTLKNINLGQLIIIPQHEDDDDELFYVCFSLFAPYPCFFFIPSASVSALYAICLYYSIKFIQILIIMFGSVQ